jgi:insulysin
MQEFPLEHALSGPHLFRHFDPAPITEILEAMTPATMRLRVTSASFKGKTDLTEQWYGTEYCEAPLAPELLARWTVLAGGAAEVPADTAALYAGLFLPGKNDFIATDFSIRCKAGDGEEEKDAVDGTLLLGNRRLVEPSVLRDDDYGTVFFWQDNFFKEPKLYMQLSLSFPPSNTSPANQVMCELFLRLLKESLNEYAYNAEIAGLAYNVEATLSGVTLTLYGFNHKLSALARAVMARLKAVVFTDEEFGRQHELLLRDFKNFAHDQPYSHAMYNATTCVATPIWHQTDKMNELAMLDADTLRAFIPVLLRRVFVRGLVHGNATVDEARELVSVVLEPFTGGDTETKETNEGKDAEEGGASGSASGSAGTSLVIPLAERRTRRVVNLPFACEFRYHKEAMDAENGNAAYLAMFVIGPDSPVVAASAGVLANIMSEKCYDTLRTKEQLGYIVHSDASRTHGVWALRIIVQSNTVDADAVDGRVERFLRIFGGEKGPLATITKEKFEDNVKAVVSKYEEADQTMKQEASRLVDAIHNGRLDFTSLKDTVAALKALTHGDVVNFFTDHVKAGGSQRRKFVSSVAAGSNSSKGGDDEAGSGHSDGDDAAKDAAKLQGYFSQLQGDAAAAKALEATLTSDPSIAEAVTEVMQGAATIADQMGDGVAEGVRAFFTDLHGKLEAAAASGDKAGADDTEGSADDAKEDDEDPGEAEPATFIDAEACIDLLSGAVGGGSKAVIRISDSVAFKQMCILYPSWSAVGTRKWRHGNAAIVAAAAEGGANDGDAVTAE